MLKIWRIHAETSCSKYRHFVMKIVLVNYVMISGQIGHYAK